MNVDVENGRHRVSVTVHRSQMESRVTIDIPRRSSAGTVVRVDMLVSPLLFYIFLLTTGLMNDG